VRIVERATGASRTAVFPSALLTSHAYRSLRAVRARLVESAGLPPFRIRSGKLESQVATFEELRPAILAMAREGLPLQRFKGLGEMNPDQLWQTTLDPSIRTLLQVKVGDSEDAAEVFSTLMGDVVEPRREFIVGNALKVANLDV
jgi:DNA gyrase subunit B